MSVIGLLCYVNYFWKQQSALNQSQRVGQRRRTRQLCASEIMTLLILFHQSHYRTFKAFYTESMCVCISAPSSPAW
jgi:hypothetical protein